MKKKILSILPLLLFTAAVVNAQFVEPTTYRGAFAPAPVVQWTDGWTNFDPQNAVYGAPTVNVSGVITANTTWSKNNVYLLQGIVYVDNLVTLTIEPGTVIRGDANTVISSLVIQRGGKIIANGTSCDPIVFTSSQAIGTRARGDWGGLTILGKGITNLVEAQIEGIGGVENRALYGGSDNADNSGSLKYVRIEYAGFAIVSGNELNSCTFGAVGSGTTVDYVQTSFGNDDAFEWFGGAVNCKHLVAYRTLDDDFDTDNGYSGIVQFGLAVKDPAVSDQPLAVNSVPGSTSEGFESDNNGTSPFTLVPKTSASFYNITQIGAFRCTNNAGGITNPTAPNGGFRRGARIRRNSELKIFNSILMNNWRGLVVDADVAANGFAAFQNNIIAMDTSFNSTVISATGKALFAENTTPTGTFINATNILLSTPCDVLVNAWNFLNPDYRPNFAANSTLAGCNLSVGASQIENPLFDDNAVTTGLELVVDVFNTVAVRSNGTITVTITIPPAFNAAVNGITTLPTSLATAIAGNAGTSVNLAADYNNTNWKFYKSGSRIIATSQAGYQILGNTTVSIGLTIRRNAGVPAGTNQNLSVNVAGGSDSILTNNGTFTGIGTL